jgi:MFS family permease
MSEETVSQKPVQVGHQTGRKRAGMFYQIKDYLHHLALFSKEARLFLLGTFFVAYTFSVYQLLLNLYFKELGFKEGFIGSILSAIALGSLLVTFPLVYWLGKVSYRRILNLSLVLSALGYALLALLVNQTGLWLAGLISGASMTGLRLVGPPFFMQSSSRRERTYLFSLNFGTWILAAIAGSISGGYLVGLFQSLAGGGVSSYRWALLCSVGMGMFGLLPFWRIRLRPTKNQGSVGLWKWSNLKRRGNVYLKLTIPLFLLGLGAGLIIPFLNLYFKILFQQSASQIGIYFAWLQIFMLAGVLFGPVLARRLGLIRTLVFSELASIPFMLILAFTNQLALAVGAFFLRGALMNMAQPLSTNFAMEAVKEEEHPLVNSLIALSWTASWVFSAGLGGKLIELYSFAPPLVIAAGLYILSAALYFLFFSAEEKKIFKPEPVPVQQVR